jgi:hypothetical protein
MAPGLSQRVSHDAQLVGSVRRLTQPRLQQVHPAGHVLLLLQLDTQWPVSASQMVPGLQSTSAVQPLHSWLSLSHVRESQGAASQSASWPQSVSDAQPTWHSLSAPQ